MWSARSSCSRRPSAPCSSSSSRWVLTLVSCSWCAHATSRVTPHTLPRTSLSHPRDGATPGTCQTQRNRDQAPDPGGGHERPRRLLATTLARQIQEEALLNGDPTPPGRCGSFQDPVTGMWGAACGASGWDQVSRLSAGSGLGLRPAPLPLRAPRCGCQRGPGRHRRRRAHLGVLDGDHGPQRTLRASPVPIVARTASGGSSTATPTPPINQPGACMLGSAWGPHRGHVLPERFRADHPRSDNSCVPVPVLGIGPPAARAPERWRRHATFVR